MERDSAEKHNNHQHFSQQGAPLYPGNIFGGLDQLIET
jgi:hypothetical protein